VNHATPNPILARWQRLVIVGPGLLGSSFALALRAAGYSGRIVGVARSRETLDAAKAVGAIDTGHDSIDAAFGEEHTGDELVILGVPLSAFAHCFKQLAAHERPGRVLTDLGSTKASVIADCRRYYPAPQRFVPAHPMAGSELQGPQHAQATLFRGRPCVVCPDEHTDADALDAARATWALTGAKVLTMNPFDHDRQVAAISHLPHLLAVLLCNTVEQVGGLQLASTGFAGASRLASSNPPMRADILEANRNEIAEVLDRFAKELNTLRGELRKGQRDDLLQRMNAAKQMRDGWDASAG
jgi:prephenate dehydrogenase